MSTADSILLQLRQASKCRALLIPNLRAEPRLLFQPSLWPYIIVLMESETFCANPGNLDAQIHLTRQRISMAVRGGIMRCCLSIVVLRLH